MPTGMSESSAYDPRSPNAPPPSMGPGAHQVSKDRPSQPDPSAILRQVTEIRSDYKLAVNSASDPPNIDIGYDIHNVPRKYTIPFENMPLTSATRWLLYGGSGRAGVSGIFVIDTVRGAENMAARPLSQSEVEGLACHASRRTLYSFAANFSAIFIGISMAWLGRKTMKFPFRKPQPLERYNNFPNRYIPLLKGQYAKASWHITRANVYTLVGLLLLNPLYNSMGNSAMMVGLYRDSRTTEVMKDIKDRGKQLTRLASNTEGQKESIPQDPSRRRYEDPDPEGYYNDNETGAVNDYGGGRDYSGNTAGDTALTDGSADTGMLDDSAVRQRESSQSSPSASTSSWNRKSQSSSQPARSSASGSGDFLDDIDDASPTAGSDPYTPIAYNPNSSGSAWDRVRQHPPPSAPNNPRGITPAGMRQKPSPSSQGLQQREQEHQASAQGGSFAYEKADEERQLAKEMAQREFDEMLERERKGSRDREVGSSRSGRGFGNQSDNGEGGGESGGESAWEKRRGR